MKNILYGIKIKAMLLFAALFFSVSLTSCSKDDEPTAEVPVAPNPNPEPPGDNNPGNGSGNDGNDDNNGNEDKGDDNKMNRNIIIRVGEQSFAATLEDNATARAFAALLPMTVTMNELNGNEKYHYLSGDLPTDSYRPGTIRNGDLMLYSSNCLVLFYETFFSSYSYTRIGRLDNPTGLADALGTGNVSISFEK